MKIDLHITIHNDFMGVLDDASKVNRWLDAIKRRHGTFHTTSMVQFPRDRKGVK